MRRTTIVFLALALALGFSAQSQIEVRGSAQTLIRPTQFKVTFAIISLEKNAYKAWKSAEGQAEDLVEDLNPTKYVRGIDLGETITSQTYNQEKMEYRYKAVKLVVIEVDSIEVFEELTQDLLKEDLIQLQKLELMALNMEEITQNLVALAIEDARSRATHLAKSAEVKLGKAIAIEVLEEPTNSFIRANKLAKYEGLPQNKMHLMAQVKVSFAIKN